MNIIQNFFDPNPHAEVMIPMYGTVHFITIVIMLAFIPLMIWKRGTVKKLAASRRFMVSIMSIYLAVDLFYWIMVWSFHYEPMYERFPFHLCGTLSLLMPILVLTERHDAIQFFAFWSINAGFISLVNPNFINDGLWTFPFLHYLFRHYFLFLLPIFLIIGNGYHINYRLFLKSMFGLMGYAIVIFLANWAFNANFMHLGKHNPLPIPFLPGNFGIWPWTLPAFIIVGIIMFHITFLVFFFSGYRSRANQS